MFIKCFLVGLLFWAGGRMSSAQTVSSGIFGYFNLTLLGSSDTIVSIPFAQLPAATVLADSYAGNVVQFQGPPGWTPGQFVYAAGVQSNTYYARIETGLLAGQYYNVLTNDATSLTLNLNGGTLNGLATNDQFSVVPYWTLGSVFVNGNGIVPSTSIIVHNTEVLIPSSTNAGINLSASATYYYYTNAGTVAWRLVGASSTNRNDDILLPNAYLVIRQKVPTNTTFTSFGGVVLSQINIPLTVNVTNKQDNAVGLARPVPISLAGSTLVASGAFTPSSNPIIHQDELLVFDNTTTNFNKSAAATYYYYNSMWQQQGFTNDFSLSNILLPGNGFIIRKASAANSPLWQNTPTYTND